MATAEIEVWVIVDEGGDYVIGKDAEAVGEAFRDELGCDDTAKRMVCVKLTVPLPVPVVLSATIPAEPSDGKITVVG